MIVAFFFKLVKKRADIADSLMVMEKLTNSGRFWLARSDAEPAQNLSTRMIFCVRWLLLTEGRNKRLHRFRDRFSGTLQAECLEGKYVI